MTLASTRAGGVLRLASLAGLFVGAIGAGCVSSRAHEGSGRDLNVSAPAPAAPLPAYEGKIFHNADGTETKFLYVRSGRGAVLSDLIKDAKIPLGTLTVKTNTELYRPDPANAASQFQIYDLMIVTGTEEQVKGVDDFVDLLEGQVPLVEIEAKVVEITSTDDFQLGAITQFTENKGNGKGNDQTLFNQATGRYDSVNSLLAQATNSAFQGQLLDLGTIQSDIQINILIQALVQQGYAEILSAPRITVMNGYPAQIITGQEVPVSQLNQIGTTTVVNVTFKQTGIKLLVVPFITGKSTIQMEVQPEVSQVIGFTSAGARGLQNPIINNRSAKTVVTVGNGETYVMGGLITNSDIEDVLKTPLLGDIPLIGALFRTTRTRKAATQLIFFITPRIIPPSGPGPKRLIIPPTDKGGG
jgi:type II secretory pathway component GspD/PulD (secretin)